MAAVVWVVSSPFNIAYLRMCMLHYVFFCVLFTVEIDLFFLFVFVVGIPFWYLTYPPRLSFPILCFSLNRSSIFLTCSTLLFFLRLLFLADRRRPPYLFNFYHFLFSSFFLLLCICVCISRRKKNVTIALLEQHTFTLLLLFDL